ncbi:hypothetical protein IscW_ISCW003323 [Ixodes scapularis]|uniref:Uncharacterized protein n=1 Tax=Ixodes scapularis TaxID=6945 RepID=B7P7T9_IXOSC|nr:hypothetical protein IscW_ISCW003323 [Ixodes scapularis]|eukprot:XP_002422545.1 hypothetical protein IscW_ISCW003323 [Ixodes scapularis]
MKKFSRLHFIVQSSIYYVCEQDIQNSFIKQVHYGDVLFLNRLKSESHDFSPRF